jgi:hypothetical protein
MATSDFGKAFAAARKDGAKTFEWNGKKYTTQTRDEAVKTPSAHRAQSDAVMAKKASAPEMSSRARTEASTARRAANTTGKRSDINAAQAAERRVVNAGLMKKYGSK